MRKQRSLVRRLCGQRGQALIETALTLPIVLVISVSIFEFGRALQVWQLLTNAAREGARVAVLPGASTRPASGSASSSTWKPAAWSTATRTRSP